MQPFLYAFAVLAGALNAILPGCNTALNKALGQPFVTALVVTAVSFTSLFVTGLVSGRLGLPSPANVAAVPWWGWIGGALGAVYLLAQLFVAQQVGAAAFMGLTVTAAIVTSVVLDHFGLFGFERHPAGVLRLAGAALMIVGVVLVARF
jgi:transporter family-2 protein